MAPDAYAALDKMASPPRCADGVVPALPDAVARQKAERVNLRRQRTSTGCCPEAPGVSFQRICPSIIRSQWLEMNRLHFKFDNTRSDTCTIHPGRTNDAFNRRSSSVPLHPAPPPLALSSPFARDDNARKQKAKGGNKLKYQIDSPFATHAPRAREPHTAAQSVATRASTSLSKQSAAYPTARSGRHSSFGDDGCGGFGYERERDAQRSVSSAAVYPPLYEDGDNSGEEGCEGVPVPELGRRGKEWGDAKKVVRLHKRDPKVRS